MVLKRPIEAHLVIFLGHEARLRALSYIRIDTILVLVKNGLFHQLAYIELESVVNLWRTIHFHFDWSVQRHAFCVADGVELKRHIVLGKVPKITVNLASIPLR